MMDLAQTAIYIYFLSVIALIIYFSARLAVNHSLEKDKLDSAKSYEDYKRSEVGFYLGLLKRKLWVLGVFGVYVGTFFFLGILNQAVSNLELPELVSIFETFSVILGWGFIPFVLFWIIYIIIFVYVSFKNMIKYQFGVGAAR